MYHEDTLPHTNGNGSAAATLTLQAERTETTPVDLFTKGVVYSWTTVYNAPAGFDAQAPYTLAMIELDDGSLLTAQLTDVDGEPEIGQRVEMVTRLLRTDGEAGVIIYGYKFRPVLDH
ncbi:MAG: Zn-ribbon domain-containing OB-fold protein [Chloroflexi bacterium]|nr:Zn-ribbon domain-containing OB-fold protein [Chloroflexota bacterium]